MYYSSGDYEAFACPKKPAGMDNKHAYAIGTEPAALFAACYLMHDGQMPGENTHILEKDPVPDGTYNGLDIPGLDYVARDDREMDSHFEAMWDLSRSIPPIEAKGVSVLGECYRLSKEDPNYPLCRATKGLGKDAGFEGKFGLSDKASMEITKLLSILDKDLYDKPIINSFDNEVLNSNSWLYWRTMFTFENWHSALEMKLYIKYYIHHIGDLPDFSMLRFTRYDQYESTILPMAKYLESHGVESHYSTKVENVEFAIGGGAGPKREHTDVGQDTIQEIQATSNFSKHNPTSMPTKKLAVHIDVDHEGDKSSVDLTGNDLMSVTNDGCVENSIMGSQNSPAAWNPGLEPGGDRDIWEHTADQDPGFGHPEKFCSDLNATKWVSTIVTAPDGKIPPYIQKICKRDPFSGKIVAGGIVTVQDSNQLISWTLSRQQRFRGQLEGQLCAGVYGLFPDKPGNYMKKPVTECTGEEICEKWLYHMDVPTDEIEALAEHHANTVLAMMSYVITFFVSRAADDYPGVVPDGATSPAFLGQFAETLRDMIFTAEYSIRAGMEAACTLLGVGRGVPEVWSSVYDACSPLNATIKLRDGTPAIDMKLNLTEKAVVKKVLKKLDDIDIAALLREYRVI